MVSRKMYCVKCRNKRACMAVKQEYDARGKPRLHGVCNQCGTHCFQYISGKSRSRSRSRTRSAGRRRSRARTNGPLPPLDFY